MRCLLCCAALNLAILVHAGEAPVDPILRIDPGMHTVAITRSAVDGQGRWLVTASHDKTARVWDLRTGQLQRVLRPPLGPANEGMYNAVALTRDGATVVLGGWTQFNDGESRLGPDGMAIYIVDRATGHLLKRIDGMPDVVERLAYSASGRYLAVTFTGHAGLRLYRTDTWALVGQDNAYGDTTSGADFSGDGRLVTSSNDGFIRLYEVDNAGLRLSVKQTAPGGKVPHGSRFAPDGKSIAVGFADTPVVNVLDAKDLALRFAPDTAGIARGDFSSVAWSTDGETLYAAGKYKGSQDINAVRQWSRAGQGAARDTLVSDNTVMDLSSLPQGGVVFATANPAWGVLDANGQRSRFAAAPIADFRDNAGRLRVSADGSTVAFALEKGGGSPAHFDLKTGVTLGEATGPALATPRIEAPGLQVTDWKNRPTPALNGKALGLRPGETSRSLAITPDGARFVLGTEWNLRLFDRDGRQRWLVITPAVTWAVNVSGDGRTVVGAFGDGTIRWFDIETGRERLAVFLHVDRKRWVAWTQTGYYQASPGGEDLIGWHVNHGNSAAADFFPASRFRARFSRPDVIARALSASSEAEALQLADADAGRGGAPAAANVLTLLPPVIEILAPQDGTLVTGSAIVVRYSTRTPGDAPVIGLRARFNGQAVSLPAARGLARMGSGGDGEVTIPISGEDGDIQLFAENKNGVSLPAVVHVSRKDAAPVDVASLLKPKLYVLAVGVSNYLNPAFHLDLPAKDARDFAEALRHQKGLLYADVQVRLLIDADATKDNILDGLDWLQHQVTAHDVGMMLIAGHGMNDNTGKYFFMPYNADPEKLLRTGVPQADIRDTLSSIAGKVVFFIDTCHSGNVLGTAKARGLDNDINAFVNDLASAENGVVVFTASTGGQFSLEDPAWGNGAFTKAVVEGLNGKADLDHTGRITHKELDYYIAERVKELTGGKQSPVSITPNGLPDFPIAIVAK